MRPDTACEHRMAELAGRAFATGIPSLTPFLTPAERMQAELSAKKAGIRCESFGGYEGAERRVAAFTDEGAPTWPIRCVRISWNGKFSAPGHRDLLGGILGLGIDRETVGDIVPRGGEAHVFALEGIAPYIARNLSRVGNASVRAELLAELPDAGPEGGAGTPVQATVASERLDAIVAEAFRLSRVRAAEAVLSGRVTVDFRQELRPDVKLLAGQLISVRGMGRVRLAEILGYTKKNRMRVSLLRQ